MGGAPVAMTENKTLVPSLATRSTGCCVMLGGFVLTLFVEGLLVEMLFVPTMKLSSTGEVWLLVLPLPTWP